MTKITLRRSFVFWILLGYAGVLLAHLGAATFLGFEQNREKRGFALQHVLRMSSPLIKDGRGHELEKYLSDAQSTGLIDFFEFDFKGKKETAGRAPKSRAVLSEPVSEGDGWVWGRADGRDITLRIASGYGWWQRLESAWGDETQRLPVDFAFVIFACLLSTGFQRTARRQTAIGVVDGSGKRESKRAKLVRQETARRAADSGDFTGVCGRASLLNQTELAGAEDAEKFFASLDDFYTDASAILARYRGRLQGVHGHELLFFFYEKDPVQECRLALAAVRDLEALATGRGFRFGASLAHGRLHGAQLLSGFALLGAPVEDTADLLQGIAGARESGIWVPESLAKIVAEFATFRVPSGGSKKFHPRALVSLKELSYAFTKAHAGSFSELAFHRGDAALAEILASLTTDPSWGNDVYVGVVSELRQVPCRRCGPEVVEAYKALLTGEFARKDSYRLSSAVALASTLLSRPQIDRALEKLFLQAVGVKDRRVRANAVELFTKFFPEREIPELRPLIRDEDNRVSANALIKAACERFDEKVISRIDERVRGGSVAHVASALHAMGEIAQYYRRHDPLFLGSKVSFLRLFDGVPGLAGHPNPMIRRQALIAAQKLGSEPIDARLRVLFSTCEDPELLGLFATVYGWRKDAVRAAA
ncbi:MAG: hypothetical protein ACXVB9_13865 [Bdellovibrionota bacterium]